MSDLVLSSAIAGLQHDLKIAGIQLFPQRWNTLFRLARNYEQEITVHRLAESGRAGSKLLDDEATTALQTIITDPAGKVVRPDFGGRSK